MVLADASRSRFKLTKCSRVRNDVRLKLNIVFANSIYMFDIVSDLDDETMAELSVSNSMIR